MWGGLGTGRLARRGAGMRRLNIRWRRHLGCRLGDNISDRADCGRESDRLGDDLVPVGTVRNLRRALSDGSDLGRIDGGSCHAQRRNQTLHGRSRRCRV